jgi:hypothetical protein
MEEIQGIDLQRCIDVADKAFSKIAEARLIDYIKGLRIQAHNFAMKEERLKNEAEQAATSRAKLIEQIGRITLGDWSAIEPLDLVEKQEKKGEAQ